MRRHSSHPSLAPPGPGLGCLGLQGTATPTVILETQVLLAKPEQGNSRHHILLFCQKSGEKGNSREHPLYTCPLNKESGPFPGGPSRILSGPLGQSEVTGQPHCEGEGKYPAPCLGALFARKVGMAAG